MEIALVIVLIAALLAALGTAPVYTARQDPAGIKLQDGYRTLVTFASAPTISFWEKSVTPPGMDGGDEIDQTTMHNDTLRTSAPRALKTMTPFSLTAAYDPNIYNTLLTLVNVKTTISILFSDGSKLAFFGFLKSFEAGELVEGTQPEITLNVVPTNCDPITGAEESYVMTSAPGT